MNRSALVSALAVALVAPSIRAQPKDVARTQIKVTKVAGNVHMLEGAGGNIGVSAGPDGILLVDDKFAQLAPKIEKALKQLSPKPLRFVLNTHWHGDHTGGNVVFGKRAPILAHDNVRVRLALAEQKGKPHSAAALPVITYADGITVHLNGEDIRVVHLGPAHTDGDSVVFFPKAKVVHLGDQFFNGTFPFIDLDSGGSVVGLIRNLEKLRTEIPDDMKIIPGHGALATPADLDRYVIMLKDTTERVKKGIAEGKTLEQLQQEKALATWESWASAFVPTERYLATLYRELGAK